MGLALLIHSLILEKVSVNDTAEFFNFGLLPMMWRVHYFHRLIKLYDILIHFLAGESEFFVTRV